MTDANEKVADLVALGIGHNDAELKRAIATRDCVKKALRCKQLNAQRQVKFQLKRRCNLKKLCDENEQIRKKLRLNNTIVRPNANSEQPSLLQAMHS